jgi:nucleotide-binding universal stress UspA family protein
LARGPKVSLVAEIVFSEPLKGGIVVGHDGSESSDRALIWALGEARLRKCVLHVVRAFGITSAPRPPDVPHGVVPSVDEFAHEVDRELREDLGRVVDEHAEVPLRTHGVYGKPAPVLIAASKEADLVVVASRGRGGFAELLVGSTTEQVVRQSEGTVVVVRG